MRRHICTRPRVASERARSICLSRSAYYLAMPGRLRQTKRLEVDNQWDAIGAQFERNAEQLLRMGHLLATDYERAVLVIEE